MEVQQVLNVVIRELEFSLSMQDRNRITFRHLLYERTLLNELEQASIVEAHGLFSMLDHVLIGLNFNSTAYIDLLAQRLVSKLETEQELSEKLSLLSYYRKEFNQIYSNEKLFLKQERSILRQYLETGLSMRHSIWKGSWNFWLFRLKRQRLRIKRKISWNVIFLRIRSALFYGQPMKRGW